MKSGSSILTAISLVTLALWSAGCATPASTGRRGLLESTSALKQSSKYSRRSNSFAAIDRSPAARAADSSDDGFAAAGRPASSSARKQRALVGTLPGQSHRRHAVEIASGNLQWPLADVKVTSSFGPRGREFHEGIDLKAPVGTPIYAAQDGTVIYSGNKIRGYGKLVVVRHFKQVSTIYAHNSRLLVKSGQYVRQGQKIAISGQTGHVTGPHLHFEVRDGLSALDPEELLPSSRTAMRDQPTTHEVVRSSQAKAQAVSQVRPIARRKPAPVAKAKRRSQGTQGRERVVATAPMPAATEVESE